MMHSFRMSMLVPAIVMSLGAPAMAQEWSERVVVSFSGAYQLATNDFSDRFEFERDLETGSTSTEYPVKGGFTFDGGVGFRLWKSLGAGVAVSYMTRDDVGHTTSSVPHPLFFNQPRQVEGDATGITRSERAVHVQLMYMVRASDSVRVVVSGGPSFFNVEQDVVTDVSISQTYPFDTADFSSAQKTRVKASAPAFNVGADVMWFLGGNFGLGGVFRFSRASVDLDAPGNRTVSIDAGGPYVGGGVRILF
jgi:hypothetical protein